MNVKPGDYFVKTRDGRLGFHEGVNLEIERGLLIATDKGELIFVISLDELAYVLLGPGD